jgi:hypothetical protein
MSLSIECVKEDLKMNKIERPKITYETIKKAAKDFSVLFPYLDHNDICSVYVHPMDGYKLAKELEAYRIWHIDFDVCVDLERFNELVVDRHRIELMDWSKTVTPPFEIGARIKGGVITGISKYRIAYYEVQEDGQIKGTRRLIPFEKAEIDE